MYAAERAEVQKAYDIDSSDPDIKHAWTSTVYAAHDIKGIDESLKTMKDLDADAKQKANESIQSMLPLLSENNQTCKVLPAATGTSFPLVAARADSKHIDAYRLEVEFPKGPANLTVDTAASGLYISRALADLNGFEAATGDPPGTARVPSVKIGSLEFQDCVVGVSETPFSGKNDGFIGTDMFAQWLITLDQPGAKLTLAALPVQASILPGDRVVPPELRGFMPVYHRQQYLLVPAMLNSKVKRLFALDTGIRWSTMNSDVAHSVSTTKVNFTNSMQTTSGKTLQVYRDSFDFQLANLTLSHESHVMELDSAVVNQNAGMQIAGMLGFDILHSFVLTLDYRDGLVKMESAEMGNSAGGKNQPEAEDCPGDGGDRPTDSTIEVKIKGLIDSAHLKPGKEVFAEMVNDWRSPDCTLPRGALVYGHVTSATSAKAPEASELGLVFDHAECDGGNKKPVPFALLGVIASPDQFVGLHSALPSQVAGGGRSISSAAAAVGDNFLDVNLNPSGPPHTVHPGIVLGFPQTELQPHGAPGCSAKISSTRGGGVRLSTGAELILVMLQKVPAAQ